MSRAAFFGCEIWGDCIQDIETYHDLMQAIGCPKFSSSEVSGPVATCLCRSVLFMRKQRRVISGTECMLMQGYPRDLLQNSNEQANHRLQELAGNSFNGFAMLVIMLAIFCCIPLQALVRKKYFRDRSLGSEPWREHDCSGSCLCQPHF